MPESPPDPIPVPVPSLRHGRYEDAQALFAGTLFVAMALMLLGQAGLLIGGTAGVAFLLHYLTDVSFGKLFFVVNLPFYWFAWTRMGREFTVKTFLSVALLSVLTEMFPHVMHVDYLNPVFAAVLGGLLLGTGGLFLARHRSSLGGATVVALYLQNRHGIRAGKAQLAIDCTVLLLALFIVPPQRVAYSVLAAVVMGVFLWVSHRPGRYVGG
ncbi:YitT family protein [Paracidovorax anthurii]|uniref:Putative 5xTM membrane YitT family protein n=1 Tax=Paracidovorax anthurii TaxID=78229 RepID=A0A328YTX1_9BURK|nr:YitT family protein [Paracidovorax anthurii]RAR76255.1 putative 5xTM membrane YitT family protein [Paracidovorax anthurii]